MSLTTNVLGGFYQGAPDAPVDATAEGLRELKRTDRVAYGRWA